MKVPLKVPFVDMKREAEALLKNSLMDDIKDVVSSGHYLFGPKSQKLENKLSERFNAYAVLVGSGTDALYLSLRSFGIGSGDKVAIPVISAIPTAVAVKMTGAECVYVEIEHNTMTMSINDLIRHEHLSAVMPVHLYGNIANIEEIYSYCNSRNIPMIEDCAQSFGAKRYEDYVGVKGAAGAFSFYPTKNLGCFGDGGAVITTNINLAAEIKELRFYGQREKYAMGNVYGINSRMDEIQSAILLKKLDFLDGLNSIRLRMLDEYNKRLSGLVHCGTLTWNFGALPHIYPVFVKNRYHFMNYMKDRGIDTAIHYPFLLSEAIDKMNNMYCIAESRVKEVVSIPFNPWMTDKEIEYVISNVVEYKQ